MSQPIKIKKWSVVYTPKDNQWFIAPELFPIKLGGLVYGHPDFDDGANVVTSRIKDVDKRLITTGSGNLYELDGPPADEYIEYLNSIGRSYDEEEPIKRKK